MAFRPAVDPRQEFFLGVCAACSSCASLCQYLGSRSPEPVKKKVLELIYSWTVALPDEAKISDAYQMLKKQGKMALPFRPTPGKCLCSS